MEEHNNFPYNYLKRTTYRTKLNKKHGAEKWVILNERGREYVTYELNLTDKGEKNIQGWGYNKNMTYSEKLFKHRLKYRPKSKQ